MFKTVHKWLMRIVSLSALLMSVVVMVMLIYDFGFPQSERSVVELERGYSAILVAMWIANTLRVIFGGSEYREHRGSSLVRNVIYGVFTVVVLSLLSIYYKFLAVDSFLTFVTSRWTIMATVAVISMLEISRAVTSVMGKRTNPAMVIASSFAFIIFAGGLLLGLPNCSHGSISFIDSLFVSTSAVCVTGLSPIDISQSLTLTGQVVLLLLIQIGGLGIMTLTSFFGLFFTGNSFAGQIAVRDLVSSDRMTGLLKFLMRIIVVTFTVEAIGALFIYIAMLNNSTMSGGEALFFSVFHSISAFCNAGFSTLSGNLYDPQVREITTVIWVISWLVIFGGIGFPIFSNALSILGHKVRNLVRWIFGLRRVVRPHMWSLNSRIVVKTTALLLGVSWAVFLALEWNASLAIYGFWDKLAQGFLMAVTPRTAGFNGVNLSEMLPASIFISMILMWIGGAPQSTAGGIKVTTFYLAVRNILKGDDMRDRIEVKGRQIPSASVRRAFGVIIASLSIITFSVITLSILEPKIDLMLLIFEAFSALGTVGLSIGVTPELSAASKVVVILLMFIGRVGIVSIIAIFLKRTVKNKNYSYPEENILIS